MWNIFEQPWTLLIAAVISLIIIVIVRAFLPEKKKYWQWLLPVLLVVLAFGLDFFIKTDLEKIKTVIDTGVKAVRNEDPPTIENIIADDYKDSRHSNKKALIQHCRFFLSQPLIDKTYTTIRKTNISAPNATVVMLVRMSIDKESEIAGFTNIMLVKAEVHLKKQQDNNWLITRTEILALNNQPAKWRDIKNP